MDKKAIMALVKQNSTTKAILKVLIARDRRPKDGIIDVRRVRHKISKREFDADDFAEFWEKLEELGIGVYTRGDLKKHINPRFELAEDFYEFLNVAQGKGTSGERRNAVMAVAPQSATTAGATYRIATQIAKALPTLPPHEIQFLVDLLQSRQQ